MSSFSDVDSSAAAPALTDYLIATDRWMSPLKAYIATTLGVLAHDGTVVDVGCGLGFDLARLTAAGTQAIGLDRSATLLARAASKGAPLVQADAAALPLRDDSVDAVRIERTLEHVEDPGIVLDEVARVVRPGGWIAVLEPDFSTYRVDSDVIADGSWPAALLLARHPNIGGDTEALLHARGFRVRDIVTESSRGYTYESGPVPTERVIDRAIREGRCDASLAQRWIEEQRARTAAGTFRARWDKVLVVATKTASSPASAPPVRPPGERGVPPR